MARGQNRYADSLATLASSIIKGVPQIIKVELVAEPNINAAIGVSMVAMSEPCRMDPIINFLPEDRASDDEKEVGKVLRVAVWY